MSERNLWVRVRAKLNWFGHFERVENGVGVGTPDVDFCVHGIEGKIELKYVPTYPARDSTPVLGRKGLRKEQVVWISRRCRNEGRVFVLVGVGTDMYLIRMTQHRAAVLNEMDHEHLAASACWEHRGRSRVRYDEMVEELIL